MTAPNRALKVHISESRHASESSSLLAYLLFTRCAEGTPNVTSVLKGDAGSEMAAWKLINNAKEQDRLKKNTLILELR